MRLGPLLLLLLRLVRGGLRLLALFAFHVVGVVAQLHLGRRGAQHQHLRRQLVEQIAVVAHDDH
ncbi:MAG: hypothetical protein ACYTGX_17420, partial [Planctomycetota bacterium]